MYLLCITDDKISKVTFTCYSGSLFQFWLVCIPAHSQKAALSTPRAPLFLLLSFPKLRERFQRHKD